MKTYTVREIKPVLLLQKYGYIALFNQEGKQIIPFNSNRITAQKRLLEIEARLDSVGLKDGFYILKGKNSLAGGTIPDEFTIIKGKPETSLPLAENRQPLEIIKTVSPDVLTYDNALKLSIECERLKLENESLKKEVLNLEKQIQELEEDAEQLAEDTPNTSLMENAQSFLSNAMGFIAPLLDKHFELKSQALGLKAVELELKMNSQQRKPPEEQPTQTKQENNYIQAFIMQYKDHSTIYEELATLYNTAKNEDEFLLSLKEYNNEFYNACLNGK
jgi:FtsZ-binding cell division protein ZapB